jgi:Fe-S oxidoreductase
METLYGLDRRRLPPAFARRTFLDWWSRERPHFEKDNGSADRRLALFADTFTNFHEPEIPIAAAQSAAAAGWSVSVPPRVCCGRPLISKGFLGEARRQAQLTIQSLLPYAEHGLPIVFVEPGCYSAVRDDHPHLLRGDLQTSARRVAAACLTFEEWAAQSSLQIPSGPQRVLLHAHCHQKALVGTGPALRLLGQIPNCDVVDLDAGCCGMAGSFGYEREHYEISKTVGERKLFPAVRSAAADIATKQTLVVAPGFSCRHQLQHFTSTAAVHPAVLLQSVLNLE